MRTITAAAILSTALFSQLYSTTLFTGTSAASDPRFDSYRIQFTVAHLPEDQKLSTVDSLAFVCASFSRQQQIELCLPRQVAKDIYEINLANLKWGNYEWNRFVAQAYPYDYYIGDQRYSITDTRRHYYPYQSPKVYKADWFTTYITDANNNSSGYALTYGFEKIPKTRQEFLKFWEVNTKAEYAFGLIETSSRVSKRNLRWLENYSIPRGYVWGTKDFFAIDPNTQRDPLKYPILNDPRQKHDGEEWIVGIPKYSSQSGERGTLQVYMLFDGAGKRVDKADGDLVEDHTRYKGFSQIRSHGSCIQCHVSGINAPTHNAIRELILSGGDVYAKYEAKEAIERFHLSDSAKEILRNNEDYATAVFCVNLRTAEDNAKIFKQVVDGYVSQVSLQTAARELYTTPENLQRSLAFESNINKKLSPYLVQLAQGLKINRETWEAVYLQAKTYLDKYNALQYP